MNEPTAVDWIIAFGSIITPLLVLLLTGVGWTISNRIKSQQEQERTRFESERERERTRFESEREQERIKFEKERERENYLRGLEEKLRSDRITIYNDILQPFIIIFANPDAFAKEKAYKGKTIIQAANEMMLSLDYKQTAFKLALIGSDQVVRAFNELMQYFYSRNSSQDLANQDLIDNTKNIMRLLGNFLLEIRKSAGNENTTVDNLEILEWLITDIRSLRN